MAKHWKHAFICLHFIALSSLCLLQYINIAGKKNKCKRLRQMVVMNVLGPLGH